MAGTMGSYSVASSGMYTSQTFMNVTTNNITNADTNGYTRQMSISSDLGSHGSKGAGVQVQEIVQIRDRYVDEKYRNELSDLTSQNTELTYSSEIENILNTVCSDGLELVIDPFFNAFEELAKDPDDPASRLMVIENGLALVETIQNANEELIEMQQGMNAELEQSIIQVNMLAKELADLNVSIVQESSEESTPTDLLDERSLVIDQLTALTGCSNTLHSDGTVSVYLNGKALVYGEVYSELEVDIVPMTQVPSVVWKESGDDFKASSGKIHGLLNVSHEGTLEDALDQLNTLAVMIAENVNAVHQSGTDMYGQVGCAFFTSSDDNQNLSASTIQVNSDLLSNSDLLVTSIDGSIGDNAIALEISALRDTVGIADKSKKIIGWIANKNSLLTTSINTTNLIVDQLNIERSSSMQVNMDEELANLMMYQQSYNANAQVLKVIDELVDLVINRM